MNSPAGRYAAWTRRQAGTVNCAHYAIAPAVAVVLLVYAVIRYHRDIAEALGVAVLAVIGIACFCAAASLAWGAVCALSWRRHRTRVRPLISDDEAASCTLDALLTPPCARACGRRAEAEVTWADGVRSGTELLCLPCWGETEAADRQAVPAAPDNAAPTASRAELDGLEALL
jgi:hypothetical protein